MAAAGFVYLIGVLEGCHKIGMSIDPESRARALSRPGLPLHVVHAIATADMRWLERVLHAAYEHARVGGEWFRLNGGDINSISRIAEAHCPDDLPKRIRLHAHAAYSRSPLPDFAPQTSGLMIRLPESARAILAALKIKNRRPMTVEVLIALEHYAEAQGVTLQTTIEVNS